MGNATIESDEGPLPGSGAMRVSRLLLVDDHAIVREGLVSLLEDEPDIDVVGESDSAHAALQFVTSNAVDVVVLDLRMPGMSAVDAIHALRAVRPELRIVILTSFFEDSEVHAVLCAGATGFLLKDAHRDDILLAIRRVAAGESWIHRPVQNRLLKLMTQGVSKDDLLTQREGQVLQLIGEGLSNKRIALKLDLQEKTVKHHMSRILAKLNVSNRTEATMTLRDASDHRQALRRDGL